MKILGLNFEDLCIMFNIFKMNIRDRYLGSKFGMLWSIINPLLILGIYVFVFGFVFKSKIPGSDKSITFVIWLISGFAPWMAISEGLCAATSSVVAGTSLVKNIVFKTELLPFAAALTGIFPMTVGLVILIVLLFVEGSALSLSFFWLLLIIPLQMLFLTGLGFFLSAINVFMRDLAQIISSILMIVLFFTPIFYTLDQLPKVAQKLTLYNPIHYLIQTFRDVLVYHQSPNIAGIAYVLFVTIFLWCFGLKFFRKLKGSFESCL